MRSEQREQPLQSSRLVKPCPFHAKWRAVSVYRANRMANGKKSKRRKVLIFTGSALLVIGVTLFVIFRKRDVPIKVQTEKVARRNITELVVANGKIQPVLQVVINPEVSGEIIELPVKEGLR